MVWTRINNFISGSYNIIWSSYPYSGKYPLPSATSVFPTTFALSFLCIVIGFSIRSANNNVYHHTIPYNSTNCKGSRCKLTFNLDKNLTMGRPISILYRIRGFPISHRRFQANDCTSQLKGDSNWRKECEQWIERETIFFGLIKINKWWQKNLFNFSQHIDYIDVKDPKTKMFIAPMGAKANVMFNDTFKLTYNGQTIPLSEDGIITRPETYDYMHSKHPKFRELFKNTIKPRFWKKHITQLKDGFQNVDFLVWMRAETNENFSKIYRYIQPNVKIGRYPKGMLPAGKYELYIENNWARNSCRIWKYFIIMQPSWYGNKDTFLHWMFWLVGSVYMIIGVIMLIIHKKRGLSLEEVAKLAEEDDRKTR